MAKRTNRIKSIEHEMRQLENLKSLEPNSTPVKYNKLSNALIDVAVAALDLVSALEVSEGDRLDFDSFYDRIDALDEALPGQK